MSSGRPLDQFHRLHATVIMLLDRVRPHLNGRDAGSWVALAPIRRDLSAALHALHCYKHTALFDPILRAGGPDVALVCHLKAQCIKLGFEYQAYQRTWASADILARWAEYRLAGLALVRHTRAMMAEQDEAIRALYAPRDAPHSAVPH